MSKIYNSFTHRRRKSDPARLERIHRAGAIYVLTRQSGVPIYPDEKPSLFSAAYTPVTALRRPCFYTSLEIKARGTELMRLQATRAACVLLGRQCEAYLVYNTGSAPLKWSSKAEQKLMGAVKGILLEVRELMINSGMDAALELLPATVMWYSGACSQKYLSEVSARVVRVEVFGVETPIFAREVAWEWVDDCNEVLRVG